MASPFRIIKAILIDPFACTVTEVEHDAGNYREIYRLISHPAHHVDLFTTACTHLLPPGDAVFVDDEGLLKGATAHFTFGGEPLAGKGLILGSDSMGETAAPRITLEQAKAMVEFPIGNNLYKRPVPPMTITILDFHPQPAPFGPPQE
jgi:hypothetical protein